MNFIARIRGQTDEAMLLFSLRRVGASGEFIKAPKGSEDTEIRGDVPDDRFDDLIGLFAKLQGAIHAGERHVQLPATDHDSITAAEAHLGGPFTDPARTRAAWSFGGDEDDYVCQTLHAGGQMDVKEIHEATGLRVEVVMKALGRLAAAQVVRKYRREGQPEAYDLARAVRDKLA